MSAKFDVVIGNPPYQEEAVGTATHKMPIYHEFMEAAHQLGKKAVLVTPARFLFNAGYTPKKWNQKKLTDPHFRVSDYFPNSDDLFPGTGIRGGVVVTVRDEDSPGEPIGTFTKFPELTSILRKVSQRSKSTPSLGDSFSPDTRYTSKMHEEHPNAVDFLAVGHENDIGTHAFSRLPFLFPSKHPEDGNEYLKMLGLIQNKRVKHWVRRDYVKGPGSFDTYKVVFPKSNGSGYFGETLSTPVVLGPGETATRSFILTGSCETPAEADAVLKYVKSKFARAMLGVLKVTQDNPARVWKHVPLQDFTENSDIDWSKSIPEIDQQLYAKYGLDDEEIEFIESHVKPMD